MSEGYSEIFKTKFKFTNQPPSERKIEIKFGRGHSDEWMLALESTDKVSVTNNTILCNYYRGKVANQTSQHSGKVHNILPTLMI